MNRFTRLLLPALFGAALIFPGEAPAQHRGSTHQREASAGHRSASGRSNTSTRSTERQSSRSTRTSSRPSTRPTTTQSTRTSRPSTRPTTTQSTRPTTRPERGGMQHGTIGTQRTDFTPQKKLSTSAGSRTNVGNRGTISTTAPDKNERTRHGQGNNYGYIGSKGQGNNKGHGNNKGNGYGNGHDKGYGNGHNNNYENNRHDRDNRGGKHHGGDNYGSGHYGHGQGHYHGGTSAPRPGAWASAPRPHYDYRRPGYRPPRPGGGYWNAPRPNPCRIHYWVPPVPRYVRVLPTVPTIGTVLGLTFGSFIDAGINTLFNAGYSISGYYDNIIYLNNVRLLGCMWPEVMVHYDDGLMCGTQFYNWTSIPDQAMYYNIYGQLSARYGTPVEITYTGGGPTATWWAGGNTGYITLSYGYGASASGMNNYYTSLTYSAY